MCPGCKLADFRLKVITDREDLERRWRACDRRGKKIVFTNGCFDLVHAGHVDFLARSRKFGDFLVVGLNSDDSVRSLNKGPSRPINSEGNRAILLAAFQFVDLVVIFGEPTPLELIRVLEPDVLVKGGDWPVDTIVGREIVSARGGTVLSISLLPGLSTTSIEQKIIEVASESTGK